MESKVGVLLDWFAIDYAAIEEYVDRGVVCVLEGWKLAQRGNQGSLAR
ncbi:hypothetical protein ACT4MK_26165 [Bradyrhizobium barranii]|jgi:hypothetical protein